MPAFKENYVRFVGVTEMHKVAPADIEDQANDLSDYTDSNVAPSAFGPTCPTGECCTGAGGAPRDVAGPKKQCRLNFQISEGVGLGDQVIRAIQALAVGTVFDVTARSSNDPGNPDGVDAPSAFISALRAMKEGDGGACKAGMTVKDTDADGVEDTFVAVTVGTPVCFEVVPKMNISVAPGEKAKFFDAFIDVLGMPGSLQLDRRKVLFLVPPTAPIAQ
jgi:hypothetical protein